MQKDEFDKYKLVLSDPTHPAYSIALGYVLEFAENAIEFQETNQRELKHRGDMLDRIVNITHLVVGNSPSETIEQTVDRAIRFIREEGGRYGG